MPRHDDTPRDLLFGLLALQNGLIGPGSSGWWHSGTRSRDKGRAMAEILVNRGDLDLTNDPRWR